MITWVPWLALALLCWIFFCPASRMGCRIAVSDEDHSTLSRQLIRMLDVPPRRGSRCRRAYSTGPRPRKGGLQRIGAVYGVVHIPPGMARHVKRGGAAHITLLHKRTAGDSLRLLQRVAVRQVVGTLSAGIEMQAMAKRGTPGQASQTRMEPVKTPVGGAVQCLHELQNGFWRGGTGSGADLYSGHDGRGLDGGARVA